MNIKNKALLKYTLASGGTAGIAIPTAVLLLERGEWDEDKRNQEMEEIQSKLVQYKNAMVEKDKKIEQLHHARKEESEAMDMLSETMNQLLGEEAADDASEEDTNVEQK